jgi:transcriptional regulator with XRE-family HTH domain
MISARQIRAARGLLGWSQSRLADRAGLSRSAIARLELDATAPHADTAEAIHAALVAEGISFIDDPAAAVVGVQLRLAGPARAAARHKPGGR